MNKNLQSLLLGYPPSDDKLIEFVNKSFELGLESIGVDTGTAHLIEKVLNLRSPLLRRNAIFLMFYTHKDIDYFYNTYENTNMFVSYNPKSIQPLIDTIKYSSLVSSRISTSNRQIILNVDNSASVLDLCKFVEKLELDPSSRLILSKDQAVADTMEDLILDYKSLSLKLSVPIGIYGNFTNKQKLMAQKCNLGPIIVPAENIMVIPSD